MNITKANNQYYSAMFEIAVNAYINGEMPVNTTSFKFSEADMATILEDAQACAKYIGGTHSKRIGNQTGSQNCDIVVDNEHIELKYIGQQTGSATYSNTSIAYFEQCLGLTSFSEYLKSYGVLDFLSKYFGDKVYNNFSPVTQQESSDFRHSRPEAYTALKQLEANAREAYVQYIYDYLSHNREALSTFASDMINKTTKGENMVADKIIVYRYNTDTISTYDKNEILDRQNNLSDFAIAGKYSLILLGFRATLAWQNGTGLNNPTIRIFI